LVFGRESKLPPILLFNNGKMAHCKLTWPAGVDALYQISSLASLISEDWSSLRSKLAPAHLLPPEFDDNHARHMSSNILLTIFVNVVFAILCTPTIPSNPLHANVGHQMKSLVKIGFLFLWCPWGQLCLTYVSASSGMSQFVSEQGGILHSTTRARLPAVQCTHVRAEYLIHVNPAWKRALCKHCASIVHLLFTSCRGAKYSLSECNFSPTSGFSTSWTLFSFPRKFKICFLKSPFESSRP
jgi:hypothetical protein